MTATTHIKRYPKARSSTLAFLEMRDRKTAQLRAEIERARIAPQKPVERDEAPRRMSAVETAYALSVKALDVFLGRSA